MPCGVYTVTGVPDAALGQVLAAINLDAPLSVDKTQQADGSWTVVATYPPCPPDEPQTTTTAYGDG